MLGGEEGARDVDALDALKVGLGIVDSGHLLLDAGAGDAAVQRRPDGGGLGVDVVKDVCQRLLVRDVQPAIRKPEPRRLGGLLERCPLVRRRLGQDVETGDMAAGLEDSAGKGDTETTAAAGDGDGLVGEREQGRVRDARRGGFRQRHVVDDGCGE